MLKYSQSAAPLVADASTRRRDGLVQERRECSSIELEDLEVDVVPGAVVPVVGHCKIMPR